MKQILLLALIQLALIADSGELTKIVDGDTVYFKTNSKTVKCRVAYIDTPEKYGSKKLDKDLKKSSIRKKDMIHAGRLATKQAEKLLEVGGIYEYKKTGDMTYGRAVCIIYTKGTTFNELMVSSGYAVPYNYYIKNITDKAHYNALSDNAKMHTLGLWSKYPNMMQSLR